MAAREADMRLRGDVPTLGDLRRFIGQLDAGGAADSSPVYFSGDRLRAFMIRFGDTEQIAREARDWALGARLQERAPRKPWWRKNLAGSA